MQETITEFPHWVTQANYLRDEFLLLKGKIDTTWPHSKILRDLLSQNKSLDEVFERASIAVLLTYDSDCLKRHKKCNSAYKTEFEAEIRKHHSAFAGKKLPKEVAIHLILIPLNTKKNLLKELDKTLRVLQSI